MITDRVTYLKELEIVNGLLTYTASELSPMSYVLLVTDIELTFGWRSVLSLSVFIAASWKCSHFPTDL